MPTALIVILIILGFYVIGVISYSVNQAITRGNDGTIYTILQPGIEAFTPTALIDGELYRVTFSGLYEYWDSWSWHKADACYKDEAGIFTERYRKLYVDGVLVGEEPFNEDRFLHTYSFAYKGTSKRPAFLLYPPTKNSATTRGGLSVAVCILSQTDQLIVDAAKRERERCEAQARLQARKERLAAAHAKHAQEENERQRQAAEQRQREAIQIRNASQAARERAAREKILTQKHELEIREQLKRLRIRSRLEGNVLDPHYRESLATQHREKVLASKAIIFDGYAEFMANEELVQAARQEAPEVFAFMEALVELVQLAERKEAEPTRLALPPPKVPKPTEGEIRAKKAHRVMREARDRAAEKRALLESAIEFKDSLESYRIDDDEKARAFQDYCDDLSMEEARSGKRLD